MIENILGNRRLEEVVLLEDEYGAIYATKEDDPDTLIKIDLFEKSTEEIDRAMIDELSLTRLPNADSIADNLD